MEFIAKIFLLLVMRKWSIHHLKLLLGEQRQMVAFLALQKLEEVVVLLPFR
jgi:hypothetical protein